ncbi:MAG: ABC transporter ATP-binding protein [Spirochaetales bacterium]|nr:ABC transporter ATP-binding protein [Spirochaetales bacterium]
MVTIRNLGFTYRKTPLFSGLDLDLQPGNIYGLLGRNGTGKTTLLKIVTGQLFPLHGDLEVHGYIPKERVPAMLSDIYFLPEEFHLPPMKGGDYMKAYAPFYPRFEAEGFRRQLEEFELPFDRNLNTLSYGQKKKFLLSFCMATGASLILLDEPTNGLDIPSKAQFRRLITGALREDQTIVISTHQVRDMENMIDPVIILDDGKIILNRNMNEISRRLSMKMFRNEPDETAVLYAEKVLGGYAAVVEEPSDDHAVDLEILFNTVMRNREKFAALFGKEDIRHE